MVDGKATHSVKPAAAAKGGKNTGLLIGGGVLLAILIVAVVAACWWYCHKKRKGKGSRREMVRKRTERKILTKTPEIKVNTIEFTVPAKSAKHRSSRDDREKLIASNDSPRSSLSESGGRTEEDGVQTAYGFLRPDLYASDAESCDGEEYPSMHIGRLWFRLEYDYATENLLVTLIQVKNLPARQQRGSMSISGSSTCDPFVRIYLLPDEKRYLQSKMKKRTRNPHFSQTFAFSMSYAMLRERTLRFTVFDVDRLMRQSVIGHALYSLENLDITVTMEEFLDLEKSALPASDSIGEVFVSLTYLTAVSKMAVTISQATNLKHPDYPTLSPYAKVTHSVLGKVMKSKKTMVHKETSDPHFEYCFEFKINPDVLEKTCFTIEMMQSTSPVLKHDKLIGRVDIGGPLVSVGKVLEHWSAALSRSNTPVKDWHYLKR